MPRHGKRFSRLDELYKAVKGEIPIGNTRLARYDEFLKGKRKIDVNQKLTPAQRKRYGFAILPFNLGYPGTTPTPSDRYVAPITAYSNAGRKTNGLNLSDADLGYADISGQTQNDDKFYPALLRVFVKDSATAAPTQKTSSLTGDPYSKYAGKSYSIPFGIPSAAQGGEPLPNYGEEDAKKFLASQMKEAAQVGTVSYEPELFRSGRRLLASPTA